METVALPVDVEPAGEGRVRPPFEHVEPQWIVRTTDAHVVGDEIENLAQAVFLKCRRHCVEILLRSELRIQCTVIDDVVSVLAAGPRFKPRRGVDVAYSKAGEIGRE